MWKQCLPFMHWPLGRGKISVLMVWAIWTMGWSIEIRAYIFSKNNSLDLKSNFVLSFRKVESVNIGFKMLLQMKGVGKGSLIMLLNSRFTGSRSSTLSWWSSSWWAWSRWSSCERWRRITQDIPKRMTSMTWRETSEMSTDGNRSAPGISELYIWMKMSSYAAGTVTSLDSYYKFRQCI